MHAAKNSTARKIALCGVLAALGLVILLAGSLFPLATFCCQVLASLLLIPVVEEFDSKISFAWYAAVAILSLVLIADKEAALLFLFLGYYPILKPKIDVCRHHVLRVFWKLLLFQAAIAGTYSVLLLVMKAQPLEEFTSGLTVILLILGNITFVLYDALLQRLQGAYHKRFHALFSGGKGF